MTISVPETLAEALSPTWLTGALQARFPGISVQQVIPGPVVDRISTNARFVVEYSGAGPPPALCIKGYFNEIGWAARHIGEPEAYFYRDLAAVAGVRTLRSVYADVDQISRHGVVITEDVIAQGAVFLDARSAYTPEQAASSLSELARLHASTWMQPQWEKAPWLSARLSAALQVWGESATIARIDANLNGPNGVRVPADVRDAYRLVDVYRAMVARLIDADASTPWCVIHGDAHLGNLYLNAARQPCLLDWQLVQRGMWYVDVGYHIASSLSVADRRACEWDLLRHYLDCLIEAGVRPPSWDAARRAVGRGIVHGFYLWSITTQVEPGLIEIMLHRMATAAADHDALTHACGII